MTKLINLWCEAIAGPQRRLKEVLLASLPAMILLVTWFAISGLENAAVLGALMYLAVVLILVVLLQLRASAKLNDLHYEMNLYANLYSNGHRLDDFYLDGAAANPSLMLLLWKYLRIRRPQSILELGSGQTTKLLSLYFEANPSAYILTLEHNEEWTRLLRPYVLRNGQCHDFRYAPLVKRQFKCRGTDVLVETDWYKTDADLAGKQFDLVLVDGPGGTPLWSRAGWLEFVPDILNKSFIVLFDDADRYGEITTIRLFIDILKATAVPHQVFEVTGVKRQVVIFSPDLEFLRYS